jgi:Fe-Mn family superoxide dismutase
MMELNRRQLLVAAGAAAAVTLLPGRGRAGDAAGFKLPPLPYAFDALEPHIDAKTMEIHHDKHHKSYVDNLNKALAGTEWLGKSVEEVIAAAPTMAADVQEAVINNAGGHYNHSLFWQTLGTEGGTPSEDFLKAWGGNFEALRKVVNETALKRFGSGWAWVVYSRADQQIKVLSTPNQDAALTKTETPLFGVDVWEHAYYLKYQNKRADYLNAFWNVVNWGVINKRFLDLAKS